MNSDRNQKIIEYIHRDPFVRFLGANVEILEPGHSRVTLTSAHPETGIFVKHREF
jgi:hypothetical protein